MPVASRPAPTFTETARRAQLIEAAIDTVNEVGYHRASLAEIARRAQVAKSAVLYYFPSKEALLLHVVEHVFTALDERLVVAVAAASGAVDRLRTYAETYIDYVDTHRSELTAGLEIVVSHRTPDGTPLYLTGAEEDTALLRRILGEGMEQGLFRRMPLRTAVDIVEAVLDASATTLQRDRHADLAPFRDQGVAVLMAGLAAPTRS
ncbi:TetR/AcrR family transcriptional regulator [Microbacterium sp. 18062]|uniref:TetR/AcrR family transcriptional regulator n=1 Tax=Microbacterium sp. 18062 TaxID=2681410 RepID=UPI00135B45BD|nr:TetR/AcrR family transcriptional regulator [Microbacterium sp. 18062]